MRRRTRFLLVAHALTTFVHAVPTFALASVLPWWGALAVGLALALATSLRLARLAHDRRRPRWQTRLIDEPMFWHWGACFIGLPASLLMLPVAWLMEWPATAAAVAGYASGLVLAGWAIWGLRRWVRVRTVEVPIAGLPPAFDGYRIAQLSDLHIGSFDPKERGLAWARLANDANADVAVVTGDLVTSGTSFYDDVAEVIAALRARDGVFVSLGNHDQWDSEQLTRAIEARGPRVLRNQWTLLERGGAQIVLAGLDDRYTGRDDIEKTLANRPAAPTVLLAHYPDSFEPAALRGVDLVLSGHTHGGQIGLPLLGERLNVATLVGQRPRGLVRLQKSTLYVNAGLGTTGPPLRLGIAPEIAVIVLRPSNLQPGAARTDGRR